VLSRDTFQAAQAQRHTAELDASFDEAMGQVREFYLGNAGDVERVAALYAAWRPVRDNILAAARRGDFARAQSLVVSEGTPIYGDIDDTLEQIITVARTRAAQFVEEAHKQQGRAERILLLVMLGGFAASFLSSAVVMRHTRRLVREHEETMERMAHHDPLTSLPNRQLFFDRFAQALRLAEREKRQAALLYVDLDRFKAVNDTYGHDAGDQLLIQVAMGFTAAVRRSDTVARLGGDEFVVMLPDVKASADVGEVAEKILKVAAAPFTFQGHVLDVGASVGIALYPADGQDEETLLALADEAMYRAKKAGRNQYSFYSNAPA